MRVLIMNPILYTSETDDIPKVSSIKDTMIYSLCMGFVKNGDEPVLIAADTYKPVQEESYPFQIIWFPCLFPMIFKPRCFPALKGLGSYLRKNNQEYDYIISSEVFSMLTFSGVLHAGKKMIVWHELGAHNNIMKKIPSKFWYNVIARLFMRTVTVIPRSERASAFVCRYCSHVLPLVIDHGVDLEKFHFNTSKDNYFVVLSQLIERKHIDGIIDSFVIFRKEINGCEDYQLKIIGDGTLRLDLQKKVRQLGEEDNILFLGKMEHEKCIPLLSKAKALLVNTTKDNSMVSIVESIAVGTPVITTSVPFNSTYIKKEKLGIVKDGWSKNELYEICKNNDEYVKNCVKYREKLSNVYLAREFNNVGGVLGK